MSTLLLDTHVVHWASAEAHRLSDAAAQAISDADSLAIASVSWYELAWLAYRGRIVPREPIASWLDRLARSLLTIPLTPAIALAAVSLPRTFVGDPADRQIYATAASSGWPVVSKDLRLREFIDGDAEVIW